MKSLLQSASDISTNYSPTKKPLSAYLGLVGIYSLWTGILMICEAKRPTRLSSLSAEELIVSAIATHKLSRLITKDRVTSPFRAPFAKFVESEGAGEIEDDARGEGMQKAVGELITCPFCMSPWVAAGIATGWAVSPRIARASCGIFAAVGIAHFLHHAYVALSEKHS